MKSVNVMIIEDSPVVQHLLARSIETDKEIKVISVVDSAEKGIEALSHLNPDVLIVDIFLPKMNGYEFTKHVMATHPIPIIIVSGLFSPNDSDKMFKAFEAGALIILPKPIGPNDTNYNAKVQELNRYIKLVSSIKLVTRRLKPEGKDGDEARLMKHIGRKFNVVGIGSSLGGPMALRTIISALPENFPLPILAVQHISPGFLEGMIMWLQKTSKLRIKVGEEGELIKPGCIYFAPDHAHMLVAKGGVINLVRENKKDVLQPSVSKLFKSIADVYGNSSIAIVLTGMGKDGSQEMVLLKQKGAVTIAQNEGTSIVFGMPGEAIKLGGVEMVLPVEEISENLLNLCGYKE